MKKEERINELATELVQTVAKNENKEDAMIILGVVETDDGERKQVVNASCGTIVSMASTISMEMMKHEPLKEAIMMAAGLNRMMDGDSSSSPFPLGLAALLAGELK